MKRLFYSGIYLLGIFLLLYPEFDWIQDAWQNSPIDSGGQMQFIAGIIWCTLVMLISKPKNMGWIDIKAIPFLVLSLFGFLAAILMDIHSVAVFSALLSGYFLVWLVKGTRIAVIAMPGAWLSLLGSPTAVYQLDKLRIASGIQVLEATDIQLLASILAICMTPILYVIAQRASTVGQKGVLAGYLLSGMLILLGLGVGGHKLELGPAYNLNLNFFTPGAWLGAEIKPSPAEQDFFAGASYTKHLYAKPDGSSIALLNITTQDIHQLHAPEYCWTGAGWKVTDRLSLSPSDENRLLPASATLIKLQKQDESVSLVYWFNSGQYSTGDIADLRIQQQISKEKEHKLYIVSTLNSTMKSDRELLEDFLHSAGKNLQDTQHGG